MAITVSEEEILHPCFYCGKDTEQEHFSKRNFIYIKHTDLQQDFGQKSIFMCWECFKSQAPQNLIQALS